MLRLAGPIGAPRNDANLAKAHDTAATRSDRMRERKPKPRAAERRMSVPIALTIAGLDPSAGAGIAADLKTFSALGVYGAAVVTALTAQNTQGVFGIHDVPPDFIAAQIDAVFADLAVGAVKIGMLGEPSAIDVVAAALDRYRPIAVVLDPVMIASSGELLLRSEALGRLRDLIGRARVVTPNIPEAAALLGTAPARDERQMSAQAQKLLAFGAGAVLIKGGHGTGAESVDILLDASGESVRLAAPRIATQNTHGTGCTFASAIAAGLAKGLPLPAAAREAKDYVSATLAAADRLGIGSGHGPLHHFQAWW
jgi:hydroxymethylpyrimidine/phosphomethylpyrimidine kinase